LLENQATVYASRLAVSANKEHLGKDDVVDVFGHAYAGVIAARDLSLVWI
jgi:hypothetical protein